jgi:nicotinamidase-related amidase
MASPPTNPSEPHRKAFIGTKSNHWLHSSTTGFDLRRPSSSAPTTSTLTIQTTTSPITVDPAKSALVIIDMQNFFLSPALGRSTDSPGHRACAQLTTRAIPAARRAGLRIVWVNWGLTDDEVREMPPGVKRAFGFYSVPHDSPHDLSTVTAGGVVEGGVGVDKHGKSVENAVYKGIGSAMGSITLSSPEGGGEVDAGPLLMRASWNADLYPPLRGAFDEGRALEVRPDVWVHKNRMSGLWGASTPLQDFLETEGITTCLFAGVNTDQCVAGTLTDAFSKGFDCVLLSDGCGTSSPGYAQECWEYNAAHTFGFCCSCEDLERGVERMLD